MPHDTDRTQLEYGSELSEYGEVPELASEQYESGELGSILGSLFGEAQAEGAFESGYQEFGEYGQSGELPEIMHDELASELLEVRSDQELDHFFGDLFKKVAGGVGQVIQSPVGQALGGILKTVAKKALPIAGGALGTFVGGPVGGMLGSKLASAAGNAFGLEYEGLSPEDREFEVARRYVRFATHAAKRAAAAQPHLDPTTVAKAAVVEAAKKYAPGLLAPLASLQMMGVQRPGAARPFQRAPGSPTFYQEPTSQYRPPVQAVGPSEPTTYPYSPSGQYQPQSSCPSCGGASGHHRRQGKWIRRGRHIVLLGV
jgi:hypothetical protein